MKIMNRNMVLPLAATLLIGAGAAWAAGTPSESPKPRGEMHDKHGMRHARMMMPSPFMAALRQLNLTDAQHKSVESLLDGAKQQNEASMAAERNSLAALGNPGDAQYATAVQAAKTLAATRIQRRADLETQIYNLLTAEQKAQLPQALANVKTKFMERREKWRDHGKQDKAAS